MTRETKIGLIVAGSFLCLVCVVVASKWRHGDDKEPEEQTIQVAAVNPTQNGNASDAKKKDAKPHAEADAKKAPGVEPKAPPLAPSEGGVTLPGAPVVLPMAPNKGVDLPPLVEFKPLGAVEVAPPKSLDLPPPLAKDLKPAPGTIGAVEFPPLKPLEVEKKEAVLPAPPKLADGSREMPPLLPPPGIVGAGGPADTKPLVMPPSVKPEVPAAALPFSDKEQPMFPALPAKDPAPKDPAPKDPAQKDGAFVFPKLPGPKDTESKDPAPMSPSLLTPMPLEKQGPPMPPTIAFPKDPPSAPPIGDPTPKLIPKIPSNDLPSVPTMPLIGVGGTKPLPIVKDSVTDPYVCVAADRTFADLSRRFYGTDKYADALQAYNRDQAQWIKNGSALLANPPTLMPGQHVEQAPAATLERSYRSLIREAGVGTVPTIPSSTPRVTISPPPGVSSVSNPALIGPGRTYKVQSPNGETVFDVAERTLGNRSQWPEIWRVNQTNPAVRPPAPIPFGTELKLP